MRFPLLTAFPLLLAALLNGTSARAETFTVGVEDVRYLPAYGVENGEYVGYARAVLDAFAKDKGYRLDYRPLPVIRLFNELVDGAIDFKFPDNPMWARSVKEGHAIAYSAPVADYVDGVTVLPARKGAGADAVGILGAVRGFTAWDWLDAIKSGTVKLQETSNFESLLRMTLAGRTDGAFGNVAVVTYQLSHVLNKPDALVYDPGLPHTRSHYSLSSIKHPDVIREFDDWMAAHAALIASLKARYEVEKGID